MKGNKEVYVIYKKEIVVSVGFSFHIKGGGGWGFILLETQKVLSCWLRKFKLGHKRKDFTANGKTIKMHFDFMTFNDQLQLQI